MSDQANGTDEEVTRRNLLRVAGVGIGAGLLGVAGTAGRTAASYCPRPPEYWAEHDWPKTDRIDDPFVLVDPADERSTAVWRLFLASDAREDKGDVLARHLLAAKLNFQVRPADDPGCVDQPLAEYDGRTVRELKAAAREWLVASNWPDDQPIWIVDGVDGASLTNALAAFNHGQLADLDCNCTGLGRDDEEFPTVTADRADGVEGLQRPSGNRSDGSERARERYSDDRDPCSGSRSRRRGPCLRPQT